jgi:elongation factor P
LISTNQFKNGNHIEVDGVVFKVVEFQHVKPARAGRSCGRSCGARPTAT